MRTVPLGGAAAQGRVALVDDEDYEIVAQYRWHVSEATRSDRNIRNGPYATANVYRAGHRTTITMHRLLTGWRLTDHINHDGLDNRRANLRPATARQNNYNRRPSPGKSSQYKGVMRHRDGRWLGFLRAEGHTRTLGLYADEIDAALAYDHAARQVMGEYAYLNFPHLDRVPKLDYRPPARKNQVSNGDLVALRRQGLTWEQISQRVGMTASGLATRWSRMSAAEKEDSAPLA